MTIGERFWAKVNKTDSCWLWLGSLNSNGRGQLWVNGKSMVAPRLSWTMHRGPIPSGLLVCHKCDNPSCVNPDHLELGDQKKNMQDCADRGRNKAFLLRTKVCINGHEKTPENVFFRISHGYQCRTCMRESNKRWLTRRIAAALASHSKTEGGAKP